MTRTARPIPTRTPKTWKFPSVQHITWKAPDGTEVGGPLELPHGWKKGDKPLPLVVAIHGGPTTSSPNDLRFDPHNGRLYFAAKGYAVLCPNYRGSTGYGDKFVTDLIGNENDIEVKDILAGIQHLIKEGIADPERIAVMGWSNGGYLTNCLITLKDPPVKIKAASSGAGIVDTVAEWGFNDEPAYPKVFKKGHAVGDAGDLQEDLADLPASVRQDADADPRRRQRRALPARPQPDAAPGPEGVPEGADANWWSTPASRTDSAS